MQHRRIETLPKTNCFENDNGQIKTKWFHNTAPQQLNIRISFCKMKMEALLLSNQGENKNYRIYEHIIDFRQMANEI